MQHSLTPKIGMFFKDQKYMRLLIATLVLLISMKLTSIFALSAFHKVDVHIHSSNRDNVKIYYTSGKKNPHFTEKYSSKPKAFPMEEGGAVRFKLRNESINNLRIDPGTSPGKYSIDKVEMHSFFGPSVVLTPSTPDIKILPDPTSSLTKTSKGWTLLAKGNDPSLTLLGNFRVNNPYFRFVFPLILALATFLLLPEVKIHTSSVKAIGTWCSRQYFIQDVTKKRSSSGMSFKTLDGLRGMAAILVLADHAELPGSNGLGPIGVLIFFCLSGFLLTIPFAKDPRRIKDGNYVRNYFFRRLKRIVPMFYFVITIQYFFHGQIGDFIRTALFIQGLGILWTVIQEVYFYILLPFIIAVNFYVLRGKPVLCASFLLVTAYLFTNKHITTLHVYMYESNMALLVGFFLCGMAMCFIFHANIYRNSKTLQRITDNHLISISLLLILVSTHYIKRFYLGVDHLNPGWVYYGNYCFFIGFFLLFVAISQSSLLAKILSSFPLRAVGIVGYSFYLLHPFVLHKIVIPSGHYMGFQVTLPPTLVFSIALLITYLLSAATYTFVERPFLKH